MILVISFRIARRRFEFSFWLFSLLFGDSFSGNVIFIRSFLFGENILLTIKYLLVAYTSCLLTKGDAINYLSHSSNDRIPTESKHESIIIYSSISKYMLDPASPTLASTLALYSLNYHSCLSSF